MGAPEVVKNQSFKIQLFSSSQKKITQIEMKSWLNSNAIIVFLVIRERPLMTSDDFGRFLTYLPTLFNPKTSDF